ncbi:gamma-glutamyltransferase family protein [Paracoccus aestuariivivens]|uniref:Gamma-glutamyltransferase n=1 Tax=Paracoccus aestuariivivens TaxID=1820333 RepID=A0A6L6JDI7_9RHOB|nr:gamma-glutamyltransferase family protein [Paracoccus aestuariivivens]MTH78799.1 gamma-glutamyltransferase [Paracoccus aestuariivivens]
MTGAVTTPHPLATEAGMAVLRNGGTAPEALIAAGAVLAVVTPHFCGLGGDAVWLVTDRNGDRRTFLAIGQGIEREIPQAEPPLRGPGAILTTAAVVDGWRHALDYARENLGGNCRWEDLLSPAVDLARNGYAVTKSQEFWTRHRANEAPNWHGFGRIFLDAGEPLAAGTMLRQPELAHSLGLLAERGAQEFYSGSLAGRIVEGLRESGAIIGREDLRRTRTRETKPLSLRYRDVTLLAPPPPTQGLTTLQIMGILAHFDLSSLSAGSPEHLHLCVEAVKRAFRDRSAIADPAFMRVTPDHLLSPEHLQAKAAEISPERALVWPERWQHGDTVFLGAMDEQGNAASVLQSTYFDWGSGVVAGDTGILWQNRGAAFSVDPSHCNAFAPGKLPFYTLNPGIALRDGKPAFVYGTQGADGQPQTLSVLLTHLIDFAEPPAKALAAPRFLLGRTFSDSRDSLKIEENVGTGTISALRRLGHEIVTIPELSPLAGQAGVVLGGTAAHDPRE